MKKDELQKIEGGDPGLSILVGVVIGVTVAAAILTLFSILSYVRYQFVDRGSSK